MGERDRGVEQRRESLLHTAMMPSRSRPGSTLAGRDGESPRLPPVFNFSGSEIVFLLLLALIVLGPEKLPDAVRKFGKSYAEFKKVTTGFQNELKSALDEPMREMRETADAFKKAAHVRPPDRPERPPRHRTDAEAARRAPCQRRRADAGPRRPR